jgi:hypothetical protein
LKESPQPVRTIDWQLAIAPTFAEVFSTKSEAEVLSAFTTLSSQFKNFDLCALAFSLSQLGKNELAFEMLSRLKGSPGEQINFWIWGYHQLKIFKGKDVAVQWMKKVLPPPMFGFASMIVYEDDEYDLLWDVLVNADTPDDLAFLWLMRAAAATQSGVEKYPHWNDLVEHYRKIDHGYYESIGRFLVGLSTEEETRVLITEPKKLCEVAYYIGLRAEVEGRYEDASDWYRASIETALDMNGEYRWSLDKLQRWKQAGKSLKRLALERSGEKEKAVLN